MIGWNREFQYLLAKIIGKIVKYQYLPAKTIHFSLSHLTLSSLSHIPLSPISSWLSFQSITLCCSWTNLIWIYSHASRQRAELEADYSSVRPCVRASVPLLGEAQNLCFCTILSEISESPMYFTVLSYGRPQNTATTYTPLPAVSAGCQSLCQHLLQVLCSKLRTTL